MRVTGMSQFDNAVAAARSQRKDAPVVSNTAEIRMDMPVWGQLKSATFVTVLLLIRLYTMIVGILFLCNVLIIENR